MTFPLHLLSKIIYPDFFWARLLTPVMILTVPEICRLYFMQKLCQPAVVNESVLLVNLLSPIKFRQWQWSVTPGFLQTSLLAVLMQLLLISSSFLFTVATIHQSAFKKPILWTIKTRFSNVSALRSSELFYPYVHLSKSLCHVQSLKYDIFSFCCNWYCWRLCLSCLFLNSTLSASDPCEHHQPREPINVSASATSICPPGCLSVQRVTHIVTSAYAPFFSTYL